ncbi:Glycosyl transferase family 2 [Aliiroseovarius halocynthiae]|uniref:Glycosyltransferase n=1 Tax=Aliiroseovarius halocynthiae TaxID=985055 RepID=A0A545SQB0_9RHOB|nr:glycosyltransferase [Aliiroseovarius halocynthiae]TQV67162.1 glycosyltransferase [Aliiroseovarius halocynthiae]SMR82108.1 Glycosyl transferase family 2 [Aliiroseovarius halocynthiae]
MTEPALSIIIITLNEQQRLPFLLEDLAAQSWVNFEVIHVDSNSDDETLARSREASAFFANYRIVEMKKRGVSLGRNVGANLARGKRLLFLDADTRLSPEFLERAVQSLDQSAAEVGVVCMSAEGLGLHYRIGFALFNAGIRATSRFFPTAIGACLFSTPSMHRQIGGFDEQLNLCEDCNYVLKAHHIEKRKVAVLEPKFRFDPRRLQQDGFFTTGLVYLRANVRRFFVGELRNQEIPYAFGHYR